jgi:methionyl aminopeptidase
MMAVSEIDTVVHSAEAIAKIEEACRIVADTFSEVKKYIKAGVSTKELDSIAEDFIRTKGAEPAFKGYEVDGKIFPYTLCISIDEEVVHGMPGTRKLKEGQIVSVDCGVCHNGYYGDSAYSFAVGDVSTEKQRLLDATQQALMLGIEQVVEGNKVYDIAKAIQTHVRELVGHGIGKHLHEEPPIPNFVPGLLHRARFPNAKLRNGMAIAIEPMVNAGQFHVHTSTDGWTVYAADGKPSAHFEHTVVVDGKTPRILTLMN